PDACLVNLAAPGALGAAAALRTAGVTVPFWGYATAPGGGAAVSLGAIDVIARPIDPERVARPLAVRVPPGSSAIAVGSDGGTLIALRQSLAQAGISIRTAWNLAQASELAASVRPHVVVVDLAAEPPGIAEFLVGLARDASTPVVVVVPGSRPDDLGAALA